MATIINEQKMVEDNIFLYEQRLKSPTRRFVDKSFVPVRYWNIRTKDSTVDSGYDDIAEILGKESPLKFSKIENLPLYGLEAIILQLQETDQGLDTGYEGEAVIMAGTIVPHQNDYFMINHLKDAYIFRVTEVAYNNVGSVDSYKISFSLEYIDNEKVDDLENQTQKEYTCVLENIGTDERCIIEKSDDERIKKIDVMYNNIVDTMMSFYYNERYNCLLGELPNGKRIYDPFQVEFINNNRLLTKKNQIDGVILSDQFKDPRRRVKYEKTIYRCLELRKIERFTTFPYHTFNGRHNPQTSFYRWLDDNIEVVDYGKEEDPITKRELFSETFKEEIRLNSPSMKDKKQILIAKFIRNEEIDISDIPLDLEDAVLDLEDANLEIFFLTPVLLYIIKTVVNEYLGRKKDYTSYDS